jgi:hypothetical protein
MLAAFVIPVVAASAQAEGPPATSSESRPLQLPKADSHKSPADAAPLRSAAAEPKLGGSVVQTVASLGAVVVVILLTGLAVKRLAKRGGGLMSALGPGGRAPSGLLEVLGRYPVAKGTTLVLLKMDRRVLLLCQGSGKLGGGAGMTTLCEVTDPEDVASILLKVRDEEGDSLAKKFQNVLSGAESEASEVLDQPVSIRTAENRAITGPDSFELTKARTNKPAAAIKTRLNTLRQADRATVRAGGGVR